MSKRAAEVTPKAIISLIEKLTPKENTQLWIGLLTESRTRNAVQTSKTPRKSGGFGRGSSISDAGLSNRPDLRPGILPVPENCLRSIYDLACKALLSQKSNAEAAQLWREIVHSLAKRLVRQSNGPPDKRHKLIDQAIGAGTDKQNAQAIFDFVAKEDPTLLFKSKRSKKPDVNPQMMMLVYWRWKGGKNNCNRSE